MSSRIEDALARLGSEHAPRPDWQTRVLAAIGTERIEGAIERLGADADPPAGWQARVLAATAERERPKRAWWTLAIPIVAVGAAAAVIAIVVTRPKQAWPFELEYSTDQTGPIVRGSVKVGDVLHATARGGDARRAVWVYRGERVLVAGCPGGARCRISDAETSADIELAAPGTYTIVAVSARGELPVPSGSLDDALAGALRVNADVKTTTLDVR